MVILLIISIVLLEEIVIYLKDKKIKKLQYEVQRLLSKVDE